MKNARTLFLLVLALLMADMGLAQSARKYAPFKVDASNSVTVNIADPALIKKYGPIFKAHGRDASSIVDWDYVLELIINWEDEDLLSEPGVSFNVAEDVFKADLATTANVERFMKAVLPIISSTQKLETFLKGYDAKK